MQWGMLGRGSSGGFYRSFSYWCHCPFKSKVLMLYETGCSSLNPLWNRKEVLLAINKLCFSSWTAFRLYVLQGRRRELMVATKFLEEKNPTKKSNPKPKQQHQKNNSSSILPSSCKSRKQHPVPEMEKNPPLFYS